MNQLQTVRCCTRHQFYKVYLSIADANSLLVHEASEQDVDKAVAAAKAAFPAWRDLTPDDRGVYLRKLSALIRENIPELARLESIAMGKPVSLYIDGKLAADTFAYYAEAGWHAQGTSSVNTPGVLGLSLRQPYGVVGAIIPWNMPLALLSIKVAPALAAGNTVVLKSSEKAPLTVSFSQPSLLEVFHLTFFSVTVCFRGKINCRGWLPTWRRQHHLRFRKSSRQCHSIPYGCALPELHWFHSHRSKNPNRSSQI